MLASLCVGVAAGASVAGRCPALHSRLAARRHLPQRCNPALLSLPHTALRPSQPKTASSSPWSTSGPAGSGSRRPSSSSFWPASRPCLGRRRSCSGACWWTLPCWACSRRAAAARAARIRASCAGVREACPDEADSCCSLLPLALFQAVFRRPRPIYNKGDMHIAVAVDRFSFPSGAGSFLLFVFSHWRRTGLREKRGGAFLSSHDSSCRARVAGVAVGGVLAALHGGRRVGTFVP